MSAACAESGLALIMVLYGSGHSQAQHINYSSSCSNFREELRLDEFCNTSRVPKGHRHDCQNWIVASVGRMKRGIADE